MATADVETGRMPDVIPSGQRAQKDHRTRRYSRKTSGGDSSPSPRTAIPPVEQRRKTRQEGVRTMGFRRRQAAVAVTAAASRRVSDSALLPPIRVSSVRQTGAGAGEGSPTHDANETSSPTSNVSFLGGGSLIAEEEHVLNGIPSLFAPAGERDPFVRSPLNRRDTQSILSIVENSDTPRLSPIATTPEHVRLKTERRVTKVAHDVINDVGAKTPTLPVDTGGVTPLSKPGVKTKTGRRVSMQSLPKLTVGEEPFSVRRKIEQFRKWHEEQYTDKLKKLKREAETDTRDTSAQPVARVQSVEIDFTKILEENMKNSGHTPKKGGHRDPHGNKRDKHSAQETDGNRTARCRSSATWRTWRDVNESYAYDDVTKYIEENELLPAERVDWIQAWLGDVEKAFNAGNDDNDIDYDMSAGLGHL